MGSPELSLDYKPNVGNKSQKPLENQVEQTQKLEEFLARLEKERVKIDAFKRELPLCMQLLNNAMEVYRKQLEVCNGEQKATMEESMAFNQKFTDGSDPSEKMSWMASVQLWGQTNDVGQTRWGGRAFLPFSKERSNRNDPVSDLALAPAKPEESGEKIRPETTFEKTENNNNNNNADVANSGGAQPASVAGACSTHRKARRCWSPDLHRRFVNALQVLGGSQVATPKQIRELMKVDGLTNDEVKSHLQKYRLHTRRPIPAPPQSAVTPGAPHLVVLGGIWVPSEYAASAGAAIYGASNNATHFCTPHEFYPPPAAPVPHNRGVVSKSPESDAKVGGEERSESTEEEEERKAGSSSSSGNVGEESNGSEVTLKF